MGASPGVLRRSRQPNDVEGRRTDIHGSRVEGKSPYESLDWWSNLLPAAHATSVPESTCLSRWEAREGGMQLEVIIGSHQTNHWAGERALRVRLSFPHLCVTIVLRRN